MDFSDFPIPYLAVQARAYFEYRKRPSSMILYFLLVGDRDAAIANTGDHAGTRMSKERYMLPEETIDATIAWLRRHAKDDAWGSEGAVESYINEGRTS